jgi:predicted secreted protein
MKNAIIAAAALASLAACTAKEEEGAEPAGHATEQADASGSVAPPTEEGVAKHITIADKDGVVEVKVGDKIQVELSGIPTAGYVWTLAETPAFLTASGETSGPTSEAQSQPGFTGGNHWEVFFFDVTAEGSGALRLEQRRPWESDEPAVDSFSVTINAVAAS